jgi:predicted GNAT family N-acyltransferase
MEFKSFTTLTENSIYIRKTVFIEEQHFNDEFDDKDNECIHVVMYDNNKAIGNTRIIYNEEHKCYAIGRVAILKEYRGLGLGKDILLYSEKEIIKHYGHVKIGVDAQKRVEEFYSKLGYIATNDEHLEEGCPHIWMIKKL